MDVNLRPIVYGQLEDVGAIVITVTLQRDGTLTLLFPGQPLYGLDHEDGARHRIREQESTEGGQRITVIDRGRP